jgi:hypothetical protein
LIDRLQASHNLSILTSPTSESEESSMNSSESKWTYPSVSSKCNQN